MAHRRVGGEAGELSDQRLAALVGGVGLSGDHQLDRPLRVQQQPAQPLGVLQQQGEALVGRHPPGKADGEHVRVEGSGDPAEAPLAGTAGTPGLGEAVADVVDQQAAGPPADLPDVLVGHVGEGRPGAVGGAEVGPKHPPVQPCPARIDPGPSVDAVGDVADRHFLWGEARPQRLEQLT